MLTLLSTAGVIAAGALTPGPNNLVVLREAARGGWPAALRSILGIVSGGLALLALVSFGAGPLLAAHPGLATAVRVVGGAYLVWLGIRLAARGSAAGSSQQTGLTGLPAGLLGLFGFQLLNPKAWVLVLTALSAARADAEPNVAWAGLVALFVAIPAASLALWSLLGVALVRSRRRPAPAWLDRTLGVLLVLCAGILLLGV
jgi:threonine/homoserine/homoserine lactone efflux protein